MAELPLELLIAEILSRLPVKSLLRFKSVCKSWYSLIEDPEFIKLHQSKNLNSNSNLYLLFRTSSSSILIADLDLNQNHICFSKIEDHPFFESQEEPHEEFEESLEEPQEDCEGSEEDLHEESQEESQEEFQEELHEEPQEELYEEIHEESQEEPEGFVLIGSCNGIFCISNMSGSETFLFNPLTKSRFKLTIDLNLNDHGVYRFGFGYDSKNDDYKYMMLRWEENDSRKAIVYSVNNKSWKTTHQPLPFVFEYGEYGVLVNETLHYCVWKEGKDCIACFHLQTETFSFIDLPGVDVYVLTEFNGSLCATIITWMMNAPDGSMNYSDEESINYSDTDEESISSSETIPSKVLDVWVMKEYGDKESWVMLFTYIRFQPAKKLIEPVVYSKDGKRILSVVNNYKVGWYDLESKTIDMITLCGSLPTRSFQQKSFVGSLVSIEPKQMHSGKETTSRQNNQ